MGAQLLGHSFATGSVRPDNHALNYPFFQGDPLESPLRGVIRAKIEYYEEGGVTSPIIEYRQLRERWAFSVSLCTWKTAYVEATSTPSSSPMRSAW